MTVLHDNAPEQECPQPLRHTLPKQERLFARKDIQNLLKRGRFCDMRGPVRFSFVTGTGSGLNRIMISVPKRNFKRSVKRNLLKRRIRESWRLQKHDLVGTGTDILFMYTAKEVLTYKDIYAAIGKIIARINSLAVKQEKPSEPTNADTTPAGKMKDADKTPTTEPAVTVEGADNGQN